MEKWRSPSIDGSIAGDEIGEGRGSEAFKRTVVGKTVPTGRQSAKEQSMASFDIACEAVRQSRQSDDWDLNAGLAVAPTERWLSIAQLSAHK